MHNNNNDSQLIQSVEYNIYTSHRHFALCESCFWSATILKRREDSVCPVCADSNISFIPLSINERSRLSMSPSYGWLDLTNNKRKGCFTK